MAGAKPKNEEPIPGVNYEQPTTSKDLLTKVQALLEHRPELVKRDFETVNGEHDNTGFKFRIMQWNILSQGKTHNECYILLVWVIML